MAISEILDGQLKNGKQQGEKSLIIIIKKDLGRTIFFLSHNISVSKNNVQSLV